LIPEAANRSSGDSLPSTTVRQRTGTAPSGSRSNGRGPRPLDFWSQGYPLAEPAAFAALDRRPRRTIGTPMPQELLMEDIDRITAAVDSAG